MEGFHNDFHGIMLGILNEKKNKKASLIHFEVTIPVKKIPLDYIIEQFLQKIDASDANNRAHIFYKFDQFLSAHWRTF